MRVEHYSGHEITHSIWSSEGKDFWEIDYLTEGWLRRSRTRSFVSMGLVVLFDQQNRYSGHEVEFPRNYIICSLK